MISIIQKKYNRRVVFESLIVRFLIGFLLSITLEIGLIELAFGAKSVESKSLNNFMMKVLLSKSTQLHDCSYIDNMCFSSGMRIDINQTDAIFLILF